MPPKKKRGLWQLTPKAQRHRRRRMSDQDCQKKSGIVSHYSRLLDTRKRTADARKRPAERLSTARGEQRSAILQNRRTRYKSLSLAAFNYDPEEKYCLNPKIPIGSLTNTCIFCRALKFPNKTPGMCCACCRRQNPYCH